MLLLVVVVVAAAAAKVMSFGKSFVHLCEPPVHCPICIHRSPVLECHGTADGVRRRGSEGCRELHLRPWLYCCCAWAIFAMTEVQRVSRAGAKDLSLHQTTFFWVDIAFASC